eukprot:CAMPEP_0117020832 /NCGR_PEP_ID=MMETSP0472-20121206/15792_1 /TAXON_ID=693140 ORGANISM="Tiarina fusus, Strain LIS" /NCGR_SAMPLE_ID=MMETSP0472 /ASSEMBLY_ACC=CAM_ASM_000603 /LENGTH=78 /DNA_ID=CAMNT_0004726155 /DNA_START=58 /DNA_END=294 /DNA_ORIENTATION=-
MTLIRNAFSKLLFPTLEGDLNKFVTKELAKAHNMTDCMLAPTAYAYESVATSGISATAQRHTRVVKVEVPIPGRGLFQ